MELQDYSEEISLEHQGASSLENNAQTMPQASVVLSDLEVERTKGVEQNRPTHPNNIASDEQLSILMNKAFPSP